MVEGWSFNPPPHWPRPPRDWMPPPSWEPDPDWGPVPPGWQLWVPTPPHRRSWPAALCVAGVIGLTAAAVIWLPRMSDAALVSGAARDSSGATLNPARMGGPIAQGTLTPALPDAGKPTVAVTPLSAATAPRFKSCNALTAVYPHGVGMPGAVDRPGRYANVKRPAKEPPLPRPYRPGVGQGPPDESPVVLATDFPAVTDFGRSTALYGANQALDVDRDGLACER